NMSGFPSHGKCEGSVAFQVLEGDREGVNLAGAKVAAGVKWPGAIHEGNGSMALFVDCSDEQRDALLPILTAQDPGLPWEILTATTTAAETPRLDTPRLAYSVLERRATIATAGALVALAAVAWMLTAIRAHDMGGMVQGLAQVGGDAEFDMAAPVFIAMWLTMM